MTINWLKIGKVVSIALPAIGGLIGSFVGAKENKQEVIDTTEKLFKEYVENK